MLVFPPCFDGSPNGQYSSKATHYSGRPQVHSKYACGLPANKSYNQKDTELVA